MSRVSNPAKGFFQCIQNVFRVRVYNRKPFLFPMHDDLALTLTKARLESATVGVCRVFAIYEGKEVGVIEYRFGEFFKSDFFGVGEGAA